ncbi:MAG: PRC-barrel domain-containing protein, partial [Acetobacteraceae bacterium]|nr:PRC-barrel domain-containing protein [Acetobacteraceae bacterium]
AGRALDRATAPGAANSSTSPSGMTGSTATGTATTGTGVTGPSGAASATTAGMTGNFAERPRISQIIGSRVYNQRGESIGEVDDVLLMQGGQGPMAVIQIGGFLGIGGRLVTVPLSELRWAADRERWMLPTASREELERRPAFEYNSLRRS